MTDHQAAGAPASPKTHKIFLTGLTSMRLGVMELHNLGNYLILEPLLENLRNRFPASRIVTTLQLSLATSERFDVESLSHWRFWKYKPTVLLLSLMDLLGAGIWRLGWALGLRLDGLLKGSLLLSQMLDSDVVLSFDGDIFGDNATPMRFAEGVLRMLIGLVLGKPVLEFASSPGPFTRSILHRWLGVATLKRLTLITNREPLSTELLAGWGVPPARMVDAACPSFLFKSKPAGAELQRILHAEGIGQSERPVAGVIICGWNMPRPPYSKVPREEDELQNFLPMIRYLLEQGGAEVVLMSHSHRTGAQGELLPGADAVIMHQIYDLLQPEKYGKHLRLVRGVYDAATTRGMIGSFNLLVSGRLHGSVSGLSQFVPTVILDYGHFPKAHKLRGLARLVGIEEYLSDPAKPEEMLGNVRQVWENRLQMQEHLQTAIPQVQARAMLNFERLDPWLRDGS